MKNYFSIITIAMVLLLNSCKPSEESVRDFDMSVFCKEYHVVIFPRNSRFYILVDKSDTDLRFIIWKNFNKDNTGYGFCYTYFPKFDDALKNGTFNSAKEAVSQAREHRDKSQRPFWLSQLVRFDKRYWMSAAGDEMVELCTE